MKARITGFETEYTKILEMAVAFATEKLHLPKNENLIVMKDVLPLGFNGVCGIGDIPLIIKLSEKIDCLKTIETFMHELVHVKQFYKNELTILDGELVFHNKKFTQTDKLEILINSGYQHLPWEVEAFALQTPLFEEFMFSLPPDELYYLDRHK